MKCSKCLCSAEETRVFNKVEMCLTCIKEETNKTTTYEITVRFTTNRELTETEKEALQSQIVVQVEEPVTTDGEDVTYSTGEIYIGEIQPTKEGN
jgi:hypothetical protein